MQQRNLFSEIEVLPLTGGEPVQVIHDIRNYLAGQAHGITRDSAILEEVIKVYFCIKHGSEIKSSLDDVEIAKEVRSRFKSIRERFSSFYSADEEILLDPSSIRYVVVSLNRIEKGSKRKIDLVSHLYEAFIGEDIKGKDGQFFTPKVAVDFLVDIVSPSPKWEIADTACGSCSFLCASALYLAATSGEDVLKKLKLTGIDKDNRLVRLAKIHLALLTGNNSVDVRSEDSLKDFQEDKYDLIVTNPPFGSKIVAAVGETQKRYQLAHKWVQDKTTGTYVKTNQLTDKTPPQVLFMERNVRALKAGGILATVVPESLISSKNYKHVVQYLIDNCYIDAVFGMPESLFKISGKGGTHTKTALLVLRKKTDPSLKQEHPIFMAEAKWCGHDSRGNSIPKNDLPEMLVNYKKFALGETYKETPLGFLLNIDEIDDLTLAPRYYDLDFKLYFEEVKRKNRLVTIHDLVNSGALSIATGDEVGKLSYGGGEIPYVRTSDISNWEVKEDVKQRVSQEVYDSLSSKQAVQYGDILLVKDGTYLIGTLGFVTDEDTKIVYQSHIYKLRVHENDWGLNPFSLLALLSSDFVQRQIKSKVLSQDIIDSLGRRIYDLAIPMPKDVEILREMADQTKLIVDMKQKTKSRLRKLKVDAYFS